MERDALRCSTTSTDAVALRYSGTALGSLGSYDLCKGDGWQYCLAGFVIDASLKYTGVCVNPLTNCSHAEIQALVASLVNLSSAVPREGAVVYCTDFTVGWKPIQVFALVVVVLGLLVVVAASIADYCGCAEEAPDAARAPLLGGAEGNDRSDLFHRRSSVNAESVGSRSLPRLSLRHSAASPGSPDDGTQPPDAAPPSTPLLIRLILALSLTRNFKRWRYWDRGNTMNVFNALRVMCWVWIVASQTVDRTRSVPGYTTSFDTQDPLYALVADPGLPIATILFISGYATQDSLAESDAFAPRTGNMLPKTKIFFTYVRLILGRWARIMPLYLSVIILLHPVMGRSGSGPYWESFALDRDGGSNCERYWWTNVLFINNIFPLDMSDRCFSWAYYFALDFQYVALSPFVTLLYFCARRAIFFTVMALCMIGSLVSIGLQDRSRPLSDNTQPQLMVIPFLSGTLMCLLCRAVEEEDDNEFRIEDPSLRAVLMASGSGVMVDSEASSVSVWVQRALRAKLNRVLAIWLGLLIQIAVIFAQWSVDIYAESDSAATAAVRTMRMPMWALGLTASMVPMVFGYGGWVRRFLSHRLWAGASRLVFAAYLLTPLITMYMNATSPSPVRAEVVQVLYRIWGNAWFTLAIAFVLHLAVERPMISLLGTTASNASAKSRFA